MTLKELRDWHAQRAEDWNSVGMKDGKMRQFHLSAVLTLDSTIGRDRKPKEGA